ncbi:2-polyprenyl-6-methoxyphenol hydroxylase [Amycolatopsis arida]|uniref:2-polyprenyl-6-methoxyphenol hydroxylase n=1 Tax=Amycolatopsis arida TaxID=587909 RepID=A0A1I5M4K9_9PSEU|nr:FAD-dependent monooxygenase [Amycolatopsis arida]TDX93951.1 2-polyprenyl-6-methoxyphenol hydroxylase-like FAD-dependent oxidoreductase [Amycolatopsis arida]SFP03971.1 2-polyprenyl-6-methoxyphenol hydroxylase [Amycolatopsis arida]
MSSDRTTETEVLVVGAGPAGLMLATELRLSGVDTVLVERQDRRPDFCRGFNLNARALDLLARRGLADRFLAEGWQAPHAPTAGLPVTLDLAGAHTDHPFSLGIPQTRVEELLEDHARDLGTDPRRGHRLDDLTQDGTGVTATIGTAGDTYRIRAGYLVGCDGGRSTVRGRAGVDFPGTDATRFSLLGDVELADPDALPFGMTAGPGGSVFTIPRPGYVRIVTEDPTPPERKDAPVTLDQLRHAVATALGRPVELRAPRWLTRFGDAARQASRYRAGRVLLAGDAAHIHPPAGAIGVNVALDDAVNLGWKLAATVRGTAPAGLLDSYHDERHAAGTQLLASTRAQVLLAEPDDRTAPLVDFLTRLAGDPGVLRALAEAVTGLDTRYPMRPETSHPWLGRLLPDLALVTPTTRTRLSALLATGRGVLLDLAPWPSLAETAAGWRDRVDIVPARCPEHPDLLAALVRPDGHLAWVRTSASGDDAGLPEALEHWFGPS